MTTQEKEGKKPLGWEDCPGVQRNRRRVHGPWIFEDTRLPLYIVFQNLAGGATIKEITKWFDGVSEEQIKAVPAHIAHILEEDRITEEAQ